MRDDLVLASRGIVKAGAVVEPHLILWWRESSRLTYMYI